MIDCKGPGMPRSLFRGGGRQRAMEQDRNRLTFAWGALCVILVAAFFYPALNKTFIFRDAFNLFYPYKAVIGESLLGFDLQLWNPWETLGQSFVGELSPGWFYPGNLLWLLFPAGVAFRLFIVSHFMLAAGFVWLWGRRLGAWGAAAACGGMSYALSGYVLTQHGMPDMLVTAAWLPGAMVFLDLCLDRWRAHWLVLFAAALSMPVLAGRAEGSLMIGAAALGWVLVKDRRDQGCGRIIGTTAVLVPAAVLAALFAMVQILPSLELGRISVKGAGFDLETATLWSFHPARLLEFFIAWPWGRFWPEPSYTACALAGWKAHYPWALTQYMGVVILAGAVAGFFAAGFRKSLSVAVLLALVIWFSTGRYGGLYSLAHELAPPLRTFRYPAKYMLVAVFMISSCGATGLSFIFEKLRAGPGRRLTSAALIVSTGSVLLLGLWALLASEPPPPAAGPSFLSCNEPRIIGGPWTALIALSLLSSLVASARLRTVRKVAPAAVAALCFFELAAANRWVTPYADPDIYLFEPAALELIREHSRRNELGLFGPSGKALPGTFRVMRDDLVPSGPYLSMTRGDYRFDRFRRIERHSLAPNFNFQYGIEELGGYSAAVTSDFDKVMRRGVSIRTMELFNVRYLIEPLDKTPGGGPLSAAGMRGDLGIKLIELPGALPRAYMVGRSLRLERPMDQLELMETHDFSRSVILQNHPHLPSPSNESDLELIPAQILSYSPEEVRIRAKTPVSCYLVLSDAFFPGWKAQVDGADRTVFRANWLVRAVRVPAGDHEVVFSYEPASFRAGLLISLGGILAAAAILAAGGVMGGRKRRG